VALRPKLILIHFHRVLAPHAKLRAAIATGAQKSGHRACEHAQRPVRMGWARLLRRVFDIIIERYGCGGKLKIVAAIEEPAVIVGVVTRLGLSTRAPPRAPAWLPQLVESARSSPRKRFCDQPVNPARPEFGQWAGIAWRLVASGRRRTANFIERAEWSAQA
jgi:hypothetical protein